MKTMKTSISSDSLFLKRSDSMVTKFIPTRNFLATPRQMCLTLFVTVVLFQSLIILTRKFDVKECSIPVLTRRERITVRDIYDVGTTVRDVNLCQEIHIALIVWSQVEARHAAHCLKTLLHHQVHPIHLHLVVNKLGRKIMETLLSSWDTVKVKISFYEDHSNSQESTYWLTQRFAILKYIPESIDKIVFLDNRIRLLYDIVSLVNSREEEHSLVSMAMDPDCTNEITWSITKRLEKNRAVNKTLSCELPSIILYNMKKMSQSSSTTQLLSLLRTNLEKITSFLPPFPTEELLLVMSSRLTLFNIIECTWHLPLRNGVDITACTLGSAVKGVLWSTYGEEFSNSVFIEEVKESVRSITLSPPVVHTSLKCTSTVSDVDTNIDYYGTYSQGACAMFTFVRSYKRRTHLYFMGDVSQFSDKPSKAGDFEVTLLVQTSLERFQVLQRVMQNWLGPAIIVFHITDEEAASLPQMIKLSTILCNRTDITYHVVYKRRGYNAINYLRNVALNSTITPYAFTLDVDLVPNPGLYASIKDNLSKQKHPTKELFIVPAFEAINDPGAAMPRNRSQLLPVLAKDKIVGYSMKRRWNLGHRPTNYEHWVRAQSPYVIRYRDYYEPYVVVPMKGAPVYNEALLERMGDKISYARMLNALGYHFRVLHSDFIIHVPHAHSTDKEREKADRFYSWCIDKFLKEDKANTDKLFSKRTLKSTSKALKPKL